MAEHPEVVLAGSDEDGRNNDDWDTPAPADASVCDPLQTYDRGGQDDSENQPGAGDVEPVDAVVGLPDVLQELPERGVAEKGDGFGGHQPGPWWRRSKDTVGGVSRQARLPWGRTSDLSHLSNVYGKCDRPEVRPHAGKSKLATPESSPRSKRSASPDRQPARAAGRPPRRGRG